MPSAYGPLPEPNLQAEVVAQKDEAVEDFVVADHPWREHREED